MFPGRYSAKYPYSSQDVLMEIDKTAFDTRFWIVDKHEKRFTLAQLCDFATQRKMVPKISNHIEIEAWVLQFRFQPKCWAVEISPSASATRIRRIWEMNLWSHGGWL